VNIRFLAFLFLPVITIQADDRLGFVTHFQQGWNVDAIVPKIVASGAGMIRDDIGWWNCEPSKGTYKLRPSDVHWISVAGRAGLKIVLCLQYPPPWYKDASGNPYDPTAYGNMAAWLAQQCAAHPEWNVVAIEVLNEPNNISYFKGSAGLTRYVALLNSTYQKVKGVNPLINVIGLGMQGDQNFTMMAQGAQGDGFTLHPYDPGDIVPEHNYEPPYKDFVQYLTAWRTHTSLPRWDTEWGNQSSLAGSEYNQALEHVRRIILCFGGGVAHSFIYDFMDAGDHSGVITASLAPKQAYTVIQRLLPYLQGLSSQGDISIDKSNSASKFDYPNFISYVFQSDSVSPVRTVATGWIGYGKADRAHFVSYGAQMSFYHPAAKTVTALNTMTGATWSPIWSQSGSSVVLKSEQVTNEPVLYVVR
jgi:Cellulase (glycosyl hydrolase family 5)